MRLATRHLTVESRAPVRARCGLPERLARYRNGLPDMSLFAAELYEYCAGIAPIVPRLLGVPQSLTGIRPSFLRRNAPRLRVRRSHQKES
jgi:hypothetical protein